MRYCKRCLYPENHPLNLTFDADGVCSGCRVHEEKDQLDWDNSAKKLEKIFDGYRHSFARNYDCVVPVSGARDSYFIIHIVKNVYKMNPLIVSYNKQYNTRLGIRNLAYLRTVFGCDFMNFTVAPQAVKRLTRSTIKKFGSIYWHCLAGQTVFPVQVAVRFKIPLIVWGVHQGCDQVGMFSHLDEVEMTRKYRKEHDLMGYEAEDLIDHNEGIGEKEVLPYIYPHDKELEKVGVRGIYLSNYIRWDSKAQHEKMIDLYGYESMEQARTFDTYNDVDCFHYSDIHDYVKYAKWGYGKVTDHACREIRLKRLSREEGIGLVEKYQNKEFSSENLLQFLEWIGMKEDVFLEAINAQRDSRIWKKEDDQWNLTDSILNHKDDKGVKDAALQKKEECCFRLTESKEPDVKDDKYILIGKGYVDEY
ncbi:MAG: N-acetyl sugar amidotransferase [Candidatus Omnitrophica bacterium]|nr:N-acetyl sugar amidotransferase [Candidatus Omnitrophota bacterium]MBU1995861.1 N-acetyl sugar amidotransferase [Candidatus Omnitrophota bacterium]MBU4334689.1 N-acetyl sugar amidotransferase [Candidatus Omnitrophota bacterium]